ncbi:fungal hydrophobin-domain-containing protein [Dichomitus squalens]|uniref:Hydrophobin n=1 Tax=Dichomitus squalens TaxID=114155 RepID=A0A4Q9MLV4_9APHY|nr:fungal hydrophobin-domain-containing protein [Dichomitus squalens]
MVMHLYAVFSAVLAASSVVATVVTRGDPSGCNTGSIQCCEDTTATNSPTGSAIITLLGLVLESTGDLLAINCSPINTGSVDGSTCSQTPVCCDNQSYGGLVNIGCVPIIL